MDVLYNQPIVDPLRDPDQDFSHCVSGNKIPNENIMAIEHHVEEDQDLDDDDAMTGSIYDSFPRQGMLKKIIFFGLVTYFYNLIFVYQF